MPTAYLIIHIILHNIQGMAAHHSRQAANKTTDIAKADRQHLLRINPYISTDESVVQCQMTLKLTKAI